MKKIALQSIPILIVLMLFMFALPIMPVNAVTTSSNVVIIPNASCIHGGTLPTSGAAYAGFTFSTMAWGSISTASLAPYDTVVLQIEYQNINAAFGTAQKADLVSWVNNGGKLIIYDSETVPGPVDYSWLPYPFTTRNPGAYGYIAPIVFVENNTLGDTDPMSTYYLDTDQSPSWSDYVGDCNFFDTFDPNWCGDIKAHNRYSDPASSWYDGSSPSWAHAYARYGDGIMIYNGFDIDPMYSSLQPSTSGTGNCAKIWLLELQQPWGANYNLPCGVRVVGISLAPATATNPVGTSHTVTAKIVDDLVQPVPGILVNFEVTSGPKMGTTGSATTDASGEATFTYSSSAAGTDVIQASFFCSDLQQDVYSNNVEKEWVLTNGVPEFGGGISASIITSIAAAFMFLRKRRY